MFRQDKNQIKTCKVIILGESNAGKTSIITRFLSNDFDYNKFTISGADQNQKTIFIKGLNKSINFEIWDTPGPRNFRALHRVLFQNTNAFILVYDITNYSSFEELRNFWINEVRDKAKNSYRILIFFLIL